MFYVYLIESGDGNRYTGYTSDSKRRIAEHNAGESKHTRKGTSWRLVFYEAYLSQQGTKRRESYLKTTQGKQALKRMLQSYYLERSSLAKQGSTT